MCILLHRYIQLWSCPVCRAASPVDLRVFSYNSHVAEAHNKLWKYLFENQIIWTIYIEIALDVLEILSYKIHRKDRYGIYIFVKVVWEIGFPDRGGKDTDSRKKDFAWNSVSWRQNRLIVWIQTISDWEYEWETSQKDQKKNIQTRPLTLKIYYPKNWQSQS